MLEGQLEVCTLKKEEEQTTFVYQNSHSTPPTLLGYRPEEEHSCMVLSIRPEVLTQLKLAHLTLYLNTMSHVRYAIRPHEKLL